MQTFVGRQRELQRLKDLQDAPRPILAVIKGRRRIGKSSLAQEFGKDYTFFEFSGVAPNDNVNAQDQLDEFASQLCTRLNLSPVTFKNWNDAFAFLTQYLTQDPTVLLFDEISWMGSKDPTFVPRIKNWWDMTLQAYPHLTLILCGSISSWIEKNILNSTALFGRISLEIDLDELSFANSRRLLQQIGAQYSHEEILKILSITGGVPWYLEQIDPKFTANENIKRLCFEPGGLFIREFNRIFHDLFEPRNPIYKEIVHHLAGGMKTLTQLRSGTHYSHSGSFSEYLKILCSAGYITEHQNWSLKTGSMGRRNLYRLSDNYIRFYIKYIEPNLAKINSQRFKHTSLSTLPGWETMMGLQVENLILKNRHLILKKLGIPPHDIVNDNPYIQHPTKRQRGCQIDYLIQTHTNNLYVCEFKFRRKEIKSDVIDSMQEKIKRFVVPKGFAISPVLIHSGGVSDAVYDRRYFYRIIDITDFWEPCSAG
ncbi:MAG: ATP-binding protein [Pseudomonadota bacterium]